MKGSSETNATVLHEINHRVLSFVSCSFVHEGRSNVEAHNLTKHTLSLPQGHHVWFLIVRRDTAKDGKVRVGEARSAALCFTYKATSCLFVELAISRLVSTIFLFLSLSESVGES